MCCTALIAISKKTETIYFVCFVGLIRLPYYTDSDRQKLLQMKQIGESRAARKKAGIDLSCYTSI